ncbi:protein-glutamate O-methyltransferase CheR [Ancylothrix sp. C2]|uniref:CheR family methyltransferase n=1 Tax=Ancylothrix sp. D3o TaxID=2953691 RepID=UPI0021BAC421|nr:protein-glutamate O-methyltransferase CheR [Ancylothrix sp. D3o]MCT7952562.1 protein-glutamate O-methyltransferase CheR [Ancylothrix sp. D3o]
MKYEENSNFTDSTVLLLRDLIEERTGINYDIGGVEMLTEKLLSCSLEGGFESLLDYYYFLKYDYSPDAWKRLMDALTVAETYFWREMDQIHALVDVLVPEYFSRSQPHPLRIWSAACASGEEPLSIAMALNEKGWFYRAPIDIYASDVSLKSLDKAKSGVYTERSFRNLPESLQEKYFSKTEKDSSGFSGDGYGAGSASPPESSSLNSSVKKFNFLGSSSEKTWRVSADLHSRIQWQQANLVDESEIKFLASSHIIFCRNVFIYFSQNSIRKTLRMFAEYMPQRAYLCVAASESLLKLSSEFDLKEIGGAFIYVKS